MAQINRIRVNNVKYNFGTQYYDDFVMRFSGKNTIYDLANGGGKSVLMLLLLQNMLPNCTLDDKQPIEKLFRSGNDNTTIHSLVEWKLDACDVQSGYKYMTTGFCARKGRDNGEESDSNRETANIEYFNYCIFYKEFGENDIKNLPLVKNGERITYNGLKNYLRDLERRDYGVEVKIFDRKGDYQNFISNFGLYESQWEIVRGINKTEGHVRTYFENNYKTTRKVVEDLLIEEIIEKSYNNRIRKDSSSTDDEEMAKTLLDIKDKLIELSKRKGEIGRYDEQIVLLEQFSGKIRRFGEIFAGKKEIQKELVQALLVCRNNVLGAKKRLEEMEQNEVSLEARYEDENRLVMLAEIETELVELDKLNALIEDTLRECSQKDTYAKEVKEELFLRENAADYLDYLENKKLYDEMVELINSTSMEEDKLKEELGRLAATKAVFAEKNIRILTENKADLQSKLNEAEQILNQSMETEQEIFGKVKTSEGLIQGLDGEIERLNSSIDELMKANDMLVADRGWELSRQTEDKISTSRNTVVELENLIMENEEKYNGLMNNRIVLESSMAKLSEEESYLFHQVEEAKEIQAKLNKMKEVYGGETVMEELLNKLNHEKHQSEAKVAELVAYENSIKNHELPAYNSAYETVYEYLKGRYGENILSGRELLASNGDGDLVARIPELPYMIFAKAGYEEISKDKVLETLNTGSYIIPVVRYEDVADETYYNTENMIPVCKNMSFLWDEAALAAELLRVKEDLAKYEDILRKNTDRYNMVFEDSVFIKSVKEKGDLDTVSSRLDRVESEKKAVIKQKENEIQKLEEIKTKINSLKESLEGEKKRLIDLEKEFAGYTKVAKENDRLLECYESKKEQQKNLANQKREYGLVRDKLAEERKKTEGIRSEYEAIGAKLAEYQKDFETNCKPYIKENAILYDSLTEEEVDSKLSAMKKQLNGGAGEASDKEKLLQSYAQSMKKSKDSIEYRGMKLEEAKEYYESGRLGVATMEKMLELKGKLAQAEKEIKEIEKSLDAQSAQKNRMEGSIEHAKKLYTDKYGEFVRQEITNPQTYIVSHRQEMSRIKEEILASVQNRKKLENDNKDILFMEKDLERIVRGAGLTIPEGNIEISVDVEVLSTEAYEGLQKQFEKIVKEETAQKNRFMEDKQTLVDALNRLEAFELAEEVKNSMVAPENVDAVEDMLRGIEETNECILLERDRVEKSISDMERIKDSFENRCVQICSNIRTELDRLPKLSRITMDDEVISIITLAIPYIKEEMYKDRMSVYINETVSGAETFNNPSDKLKYMKSRLSWKKMFSVIVTDMNSIKLCLYKREHIKDQSRYLKYEEAVGSTGQSQGIYIQFLIAIIHYIASINAMGKDTAVIGKTIFIDNPFGAAKDVYIWEPIFKLLKTNHVQLVVPARGATPAITKMFDVNYVLGQKMVAKRQQTVVVDYRSQVQTEEMEYKTMEYEQTTLDL